MHCNCYNDTMKTLLAVLGVLLGSTVFPAFAAPTVPLDSGAILEETKRSPTARPPQPDAPALRIDEPRPDEALDDVQTIPVSAFRLSGELPPGVPADELQALLAGEAGRSHTLKSLAGVTQRLTRHLRERGYLLAFAYLPAQEIKNGEVAIAVVPGRYGQVRVTGNAGGQRDDLVPGLFADLHPGEAIKASALERALLLANDVPGLQVNASLAPGAQTGEADLNVTTAQKDRINAVVYADNWGNRYTGQGRGGAQVSINGIFGTGDNLVLGGLSSFDGLKNYDLGYGTLIGHSGLKLSLRHSKTSYVLGEEFADMDATGTAKTNSAELVYPLIRSRETNLNASVGYERKALTDDLDSVDSHVDKTSRQWHVGLAGNVSDGLGGGGYNALSLVFTQGRLAIGDPDARANDATTARTAGHFAKLNLDYRREQRITQNLQLNVALAGQYADGNLDSSEKFYLGGPNGVRAYPQSEAPGDLGGRASAELRQTITPWATAILGGKDKLYASVFYDHGTVRINKDRWNGASGDNTRSLRGAGIGLLWQRDERASIRLDYAWKLGSEEATADKDRHGRLWLQGVLRF